MGGMSEDVVTPANLVRVHSHPERAAPVLWTGAARAVLWTSRGAQAAVVVAGFDEPPDEEPPDEEPEDDEPEDDEPDEEPDEEPEEDVDESELLVSAAVDEVDGEDDDSDEPFLGRESVR